MKAGNQDNFIAAPDEMLLITGASGFIGCRLVDNLLARGFRRLRCFVRPSSNARLIQNIASSYPGTTEIMTGNLLSSEDCDAAATGAAVIFHLAAGTGQKSVPDAFMNSVVPARNLLDAALRQRCLRRFLNVSSFTVYANRANPRGRLLDESAPVETRPELREEAYCFAKVKQDEIVAEYGKNFGLPYVIVRPGSVYGPGKPVIASRVGIDTFGVFLHLGGSNTMPFTYVDNCADAIALAGLVRGIDGEIFNVVDDDLPSSREFLRMYKQNVARFKSIYLPHAASYTLCYLWERYSQWSRGQLPPVFNRRRWHAFWKKTRYSNEKLKTRAGWAPSVPTAEGLRRYFESCKQGLANA